MRSHWRPSRRSGSSPPTSSSQARWSSTWTPPALFSVRSDSSLRPDGLLVVTTPNAYRLLNFLAPVGGVELVHPDHTAWHSPHTLATLLARGGWEVEGAAYYQNPAPQLDGVTGALVETGRAVFVRLGRLAPFWSDGLVVWARPAPALARLRLSGARGRSSVG